MSLTGLEHVLVLSDEIHATRKFYCDVVGLRVGPRPALEFPGYWLYANPHSACVHVAERHAYLKHASALGLPASGDRSPGSGGGAIDHIAFDESDYEAAAARIRAAGLSAVSNVVPGGPRQLFIHDPNGVRVEINVK
jgi:catechol 2,3-dioxygenase-like lactoylglutathione lyase family enzyme